MSQKVCLEDSDFVAAELLRSLSSQVLCREGLDAASARPASTAASGMLRAQQQRSAHFQQHVHAQLTPHASLTITPHMQPKLGSMATFHSHVAGVGAGVGVGFAPHTPATLARTMASPAASSMGHTAAGTPITPAHEHNAGGVAMAEADKFCAPGDSRAQAREKLLRRRKLNCETARRSRIRQKLFAAYLANRTQMLENENSAARNTVIRMLGTSGQKIVDDCAVQLPGEIEYPESMQPVGAEFRAVAPKNNDSSGRKDAASVLAQNRERNRENSRRTRMRRKLQLDTLQERLRLLESENRLIKTAVMQSGRCEAGNVLSALGCVQETPGQSTSDRDAARASGEYELEFPDGGAGVGMVHVHGAEGMPPTSAFGLEIGVLNGLLSVVGFAKEFKSEGVLKKVALGDVLMSVNGDNFDTENCNSDALNKALVMLGSAHNPITLRLIATPLFETDTLDVCLSNMCAKRTTIRRRSASDAGFDGDDVPSSAARKRERVEGTSGSAAAPPKASQHGVEQALDDDHHTDAADNNSGDASRGHERLGYRAERRRRLNRETAKRSRVRQKLFVRFMNSRSTSLTRENKLVRDAVSAQLDASSADAVLRRCDLAMTIASAASNARLAQAAQDDADSLSADAACTGDDNSLDAHARRERSRQRNRLSSKRTRQRQKRAVETLQASLQLLEHENMLLKRSITELHPKTATRLFDSIGCGSGVLVAKQLKLYGIEAPTSAAAIANGQPGPNAEYEVTISKDKVSTQTGAKLTIGLDDGLLCVTSCQEGADEDNGNTTKGGNESNSGDWSKQNPSRACSLGDVVMSINGDNCDSEDNDPTGLRDAQVLLNRSKDTVTLRLISAPKDGTDTLVSCLRQMNMPRMTQLPLPVWCH